MLRIAGRTRHGLKPAFNIGLNPAHWLFPNLAFFSNLALGAFDPVSGNEINLRNNAAFAPGTEGEALSTDANDDSGYCAGAPDLYSIVNDHTLIWYGDPISYAENCGFLCVPYFTGSWASPFLSTSFIRNSINSIMRVHFAPATNNINFFSGTNYLTTGSPVLYSASIYISGAQYVCDFYRDGIFHSSDTYAGTGNIDWGNQADVVINCSDRYGNAVEGVNGLCYLAAIANRALSADEHFRFASEVIGRDWALFLPSRRLHFIPPGGLTLAVQDMSHAQTFDSVDLVQANTLAVQDNSQAQSFESIALTQKHILAIQDIVQSQTLDNVDLTQANVLALQDMLQDQFFESMGLTQAHTLAVQDASQPQSFDNVELSLSVMLIPQDMLQGQSFDNLDLTQTHVLQLSDALQSQSFENIDLTQANVLVIDDISHIYTLENITLQLGFLFRTPLLRSMTMQGDLRSAAIQPDIRGVTIQPDRRTILFH